MLRIRLFSCALSLAICLPIFPASAEPYKRLPPKGMQLAASDRSELQGRCEELSRRIDQLAGRSEDARTWRPDVEVLVRAVRLALEQDLFFKPRDVEAAYQLLDEAGRRLARAARGDRGLRLMGLQNETSDEPQLLAGGFVSRIDGSVQPYGLVVPAEYNPDATTRHRLDVWLHGRGDTKTEVPFLAERMTGRGQYAPESTFVLHPFGRHCNAFKFAGETDVYEALDHVRELVPIDGQRVSIRGFSMGGAGCWHFAVHDPGRWFAVNPGAGFVDTLVYQGWDKQGCPFPIGETRRRLLTWYDVLPWVTNLSNTRTVAYSGEVDKQKQAADRVFDASQSAGIEWPYVIGKGMGHKIDAESAAIIDQQLADWASQVWQQPRSEIDFSTYTLRYSRMAWLQLTGLERHWTKGRVVARLVGDRSIEMTTEGVTGLKLDFRDSGWPKLPVNAELMIDGQKLVIEDWDRAAGIQCELRREDDWKVVEQIDSTLRKRPGLQGPIDDAFCDRFVFVVPSRPARHGIVQRWIDRELDYAQDRWRRLMRGRVNLVRDTEVTAEQIKNCHLICFGDYGSNQYLAKLAPRLPIRWSSDQLRVGEQRFDPSRNAAVFCFPNPDNPDRYVVVNSGMTFREFSNVSNSRQIAMLPDWAILDLKTEDDAIFAGEVVAEGFFDERWQLAP